MTSSGFLFLRLIFLLWLQSGLLRPTGSSHDSMWLVGPGLNLTVLPALPSPQEAVQLCPLSSFCRWASRRVSVPLTGREVTVARTFREWLFPGYSRPAADRPRGKHSPRRQGTLLQMLGRGSPGCSGGVGDTSSRSPTALPSSLTGILTQPKGLRTPS